MADRPILFSAPMVRALLAGTKTQTRRLLKPQPGPDGVYSDIRSAKRALRIVKGDWLWVREAWRTSIAADTKKPSALEVPGGGFGWPVWYGADGGAVTWRGSNDGGEGFVTPGKIRPSMFMPRWASRLTLTVTEVRGQRLRVISEEDAIAEGVTLLPSGRYHCGFDEDGEITCKSPVTAYANLWNSIKGDGAWMSNPWVVAYSFTVERRNIDAEG